jgi:2-phosphoglycerate kinase
MTPSLPRVILVGGAPMSGKSTVARVLADRHRYACIATDDLGAAVRALSPPRAEDTEDHREYYVARSVEELWQQALAGHRALGPAIDAVVRRHASWAAPAVIEGWALVPDDGVGDGVRDLGRVWLLASRELLEARVRADRAFWAGASDEEAMITKFVARSLRLDEHLRAVAQQRPLHLVQLMGAEAPDAIADRIEALLATR